MKNIPLRLQRLDPEWTVPIAYLILAFVSMGLLIPWLGFYWDDWPQLLAYQTGGESGFWDYFSSDRPLSAWTHILFSPIFGTSSVGWHLFSLGLRWLCSVAVWRLIGSIWPERGGLAALTGLFFLLYPVFSQQSIAVAYHQHWLQYLLFVLSLLCMVKAGRSRQIWKNLGYTAAALAAQGLQLSISEYFLAAEFIRLVILWIILLRGDHPGRWKQVRRVAFAWFPYILVLSVYLVWRFGFLHLPEGVNSLETLRNLAQNPFELLLQLGRSVFWDIFYIQVGTWGRVFTLTPDQITQPFILMAWLVGAATGAGAAAYFMRLGLPEARKGEAGRAVGVPFVLGAIGLLLGPIPVWVLGESILNDPDPFHADRYALAAMLGAGLLLAALVDWLGRRRVQRAVLAGWIVFLCVSFQLRAANDFRWLTIEQNRFYRQLFWRAPAPLPGTAFVTEKVIFPFQGNFSTSSAINLLYPKRGAAEKMDFWLYALLPRYSQGAPKNEQAYFQTRMRSFYFTGASMQAVFLETGNSRQNCLWVLTADDLENPYISEYYRSWLNESYRIQIGADEKAVPTFVHVFGSPAEPDWCYYFEKAEFAVQMGDWAEAANLGELAQEDGFNPQRSFSDSPREWVPFIQGYLLNGQWAQAADLTKIAIANDPAYQRMYCRLWDRLREKEPAGGETAEMVREQLGCADLR